ncbi:MAG: ArsR family transcriptional regulator [Euryarchaeota archaeon]|nr:ArsR family transcriptional regulator [Euryarchaeota archaeon]
MNEVLALETRQKIYDLLQKNPGLHLSKIADMLHMRISLVEYHLLYMEKNSVVLAQKEKGYKRYYTEGSKIGSEEKKNLALLRREVPLRIVLFLLNHPQTNHMGILQQFKIAQSTLTYHLKNLENGGIICVQRDGKEKLYTVVNEKEIVQLLIQYKPYQVLASFKDIWSDLQVE